MARELKLLRVLITTINVNLAANSQKISIYQNLIIGMILLIPMTYVCLFKLSFVVLSWNGTLFAKILTFSYWNTFLIAAYTVSYSILIRLKSFELLWIKANELQMCFFNKLKSEMKTNLILSGIHFLLNTVTLTLFIYKGKEKFDVLDLVLYLNVILLQFLKFVVKLQYLVFTSIFKGCYKEINDVIRRDFRMDNEIDKVALIKLMGKSHQMILDMNGLIDEITGPLILTDVIYAFVFFVAYIYNLITSYYYQLNGNDDFDTKFVIHGLEQVLTLIVFVIRPSLGIALEQEVKENLLSFSNCNPHSNFNKYVSFI